MPSRRMRLLTLGVPVAASLALAGPAVAAGEAKGDKAILKAGVITKADGPAEGAPKRGQTKGAAPKGNEGAKKIKTARGDARKEHPRAGSRDFSDPVPEHATTAENAVYAFSNKASATKFMRTYQRSAAKTCFDKLATEITKDRPTAAPPSAAPITDLQGVGNEA